MTYPNSELIELAEREDICKKYLILRQGYKQFAIMWHQIAANIYLTNHSNNSFEECTNEVCKLSRKLLEETKI